MGMAGTVRIEITFFCFRVSFSVARMARMESLDSKNFVVIEDNYATVEEFDGELAETTAVVQAAVYNIARHVAILKTGPKNVLGTKDHVSEKDLGQRGRRGWTARTSL